MKAIFRTYLNESRTLNKIVEIDDSHNFSEGPYQDTVPFSVGSNQAILPSDASLISDSQSLESATSRGYSIPIYDDGFGPLWIYRDSMGISGIVRAQTWHEAYEICEDEFFPEASETWAEMGKEYATIYLSGRELWEHKKGKLLEKWGWNDLTPEARKKIHSMPGEDVPYIGEVTEHPCWQEAYGFRPNGARSGKWENGEPRDPIGHGIYAKDLNGDSLEKLTPELIEALEITLEIANCD